MLIPTAETWASVDAVLERWTSRGSVYRWSDALGRPALEPGGFCRGERSPVGAPGRAGAPGPDGAGEVRK